MFALGSYFYLYLDEILTPHDSYSVNLDVLENKWHENKENVTKANQLISRYNFEKWKILTWSVILFLFTFKVKLSQIQEKFGSSHNS